MGVAGITTNMPASEATRKEICQQLRNHYRELSAEVGHSNHSMMLAIDAYEREDNFKSSLTSMVNMYQFEVRRREEEQEEMEELREHLNKHISFLDKHHKGWEDVWNEEI